MGGALQRARTGQLVRLAGVSSPRRVLIVGEGDGSFLLSFVRQFPEAAITVVEPSAGMVARAQARLRQADLGTERIEFVVQPLLETGLPEASFDLIVTLFFFDNFEHAEVVRLIDFLATRALPDCDWLLSDFCLPARGWRRLRARIWLKLLYGFFGIATGIPARELPDSEGAIENVNFLLVDRQTNCGGLLFSARYRSK